MFHFTESSDVLASLASNEYAMDVKYQTIVLLKWLLEIRRQAREFFKDKNSEVKWLALGSALGRIHGLDLPPKDAIITTFTSLGSGIPTNLHLPLFLGGGGRSNTWALVILSFKPLLNMLPLKKQKKGSSICNVITCTCCWSVHIANCPATASGQGVVKLQVEVEIFRIGKNKCQIWSNGLVWVPF